MTQSVTLNRPWLTLDLGHPHRILSWAINRPGFVESTRIVWREVRNADLPQNMDVDVWLQNELTQRGSRDAVVFLTSRDVRAYTDVSQTVDGITVRCVATVGLSNAERVGARVDRSGKDWGTINIAVTTSTGLTDAARIEALSIAAQARTIAVLDADLALPTGRASGTGTDCIAVAAPEGAEKYAGLHTSLGEAIGQAVLNAVSSGVTEWMTHVRREGEI